MDWDDFYKEAKITAWSGGEPLPGADTLVDMEEQRMNKTHGAVDGRRACDSLKRTRLAKDGEAPTCGRCLRILGSVLVEAAIPPEPSGGSIPPQSIPSDRLDREAWLEWRRHGLGGSDMAAILGLSPWATSFDVWFSKVHGGQISDSAAMAFGRDAEELVAKKASERWGCEVFEAKPVAHEDRPWIRGTADFLMTDWKGLVGLECKTTRDRWEDGVPLYYQVQCQWYMLVYGYHHWRLACLHRSSAEYSFHEIERDEAVIAVLEQRATEWWRRHILDGERPPLAGKAAGAYLLQEHGRPTGDVRAVRGDDAELVRAFAQARADRKAAEEHEKALALQIQERIGDDHGLEVDGLTVTWSRFQKKSTDFQALRADARAKDALDRLCAPFTTTTTSGRLNVREETP